MTYSRITSIEYVSEGPGNLAARARLEYKPAYPRDDRVEIKILITGNNLTQELHRLRAIKDNGIAVSIDKDKPT